MEFVIVNGEIVKKEEAELTSFLWNNPLLFTEKVWFGYGGIPLLAEKIQQILHQFRILGASLPDLFLNQQELFRKLKRMLNKNRFYRSGLIRIQLLISDSETNFVVFATPFEQSEFTYQGKGILIRFAEQKKYSGNLSGPNDNFNHIFQWLAAAGDNESTIRNFIFLNEKGMICDAGTANVFLIQKNILMTPSLSSGCITDNLRQLVMEAAKNKGFQLMEPKEISPETVFKVEEIFFASEATGIQWILGIDTKRFVHHVSGQIHEELNKILKSKVH